MKSDMKCLKKMMYCCDTLCGVRCTYIIRPVTSMTFSESIIFINVILLLYRNDIVYCCTEGGHARRVS